MAVTSPPAKSVAPINVPGQLTLRTIQGRNGPFTVGRRSQRITQLARLGELGYALDFKTQEWSRQVELQPV